MRGAAPAFDRGDAISPGLREEVSTVKAAIGRPLGVVLILCAIALVTYPVLWKQAPLKYPDSGALIDFAEDIRDGRLDEMRDRTVAVPLLVLAFGQDRGFFYFSLVSYVGATALLAWCMLHLGMRRQLVWMATALILLPHHAQLAGTLMTEAATMVILIASVVTLLTYLRRGGDGMMLLSAILFAMCAFVRPTYQLLGVLVGCLLFLYRGSGERFRRAALAVTVVSVVLIGAYLVHNRVRFGWTALTNGMGYHLGTRASEVYERIEDPELREVVVRHRNQLYVNRGQVSQTWYGVRKELIAKGMDRQEMARLAQRENTRLILRSPLAYLQTVCQSFGYYVQPFITPLVAAFGPAQYGFALLTLLLEILFVLLQVAIWGGWMMSQYNGREDLKVHLPFAWVLATMIIFYTMAISCAVDVGEPRYRAPTDPLIVFVTLYSFTVLSGIRERANAHLATK